MVMLYLKMEPGTVSLKAGGSITISDIPAGVAYSVTEKEVDGYETTCESNSGTIAKDSNSTVNFVNTKKPEPVPGAGGAEGEKYTNITVKKVVTGNSEVENSYNFEISFSNLKANKIYTMSNGTSFTSDSNGLANVSISLKNSESVTVQDIPVGSKYKVYEHAGDYISSYVITDNNNVGLINNNTNNNTKVNQDLSTATETADEGEDVVITFTNEKIVTQNLKLTKVVTDENDKNSYMFDIEFSNMKEKSSFNSSVGKITAEPNGKANITIYLAGGDVTEFYDVPVGTKYKITELASGSIASYIVTDENGMNKIVSGSKANTTNKTALSTAEEVVNEGEEVTITFMNDTVNQEPDSTSASIGVSKKVVDDTGKIFENCDDTFTFEITPEDETNPMPENKTITITGNGEESFGTITFTKVGTYSYKVTEKAGDLNYYSYDDSVYTIVYDVTNADGLLEVTKSVKKNGFNNDVIAFTNKFSRADVKIQKTDEEGKPLTGAKLQILDNEGNVVEEWITEENKAEEDNAEVNNTEQNSGNQNEEISKGTHTVKLLPGTYILHEVKAPEGYEVAEDITFVVSKDGTVSVNNEIVEKIIMKDPSKKEEQNNPDDNKEENQNNSDNNKEENQNNSDNDNTKNEKKYDSLKTGDKIIIYTFTIALAGLILIIIAKKKKSYKTRGKH